MLNKSARDRPRFRGAPVDLVVDVRSKLEFWTGHIPGAVCIPVDQLPEGLEGRGLTADSRILVYCGVGTRSANAATLLKQGGYRNVVDGGAMKDAWTHFEP
jgi:rhodanese-related sulfurtransferase